MSRDYEILPNTTRILLWNFLFDNYFPILFECSVWIYVICLPRSFLLNLFLLPVMYYDLWLVKILLAMWTRFSDWLLVQLHRISSMSDCQNIVTKLISRLIFFNITKKNGMKFRIRPFEMFSTYYQRLTQQQSSVIFCYSPVQSDGISSSWLPENITYSYICLS